MKHVTVLGGGFVGCEVALAVAKRGRGRGMVVSHVSDARGDGNMLRSVEHCNTSFAQELLVLVLKLMLVLVLLLFC